MFGMRMLFIGIIASALLGAGAYVMKLQRDNAILKENAIKLESAVAEQQTLIENQKKDFAEILAANQKMNELVTALKNDLDNLDKRFNKGKRDVGKLAIERTKVIEKILNKGSVNAKRCVEIASGAELTENERNATKKSEINPECPSIANPNYIPYQLFGCKKVNDDPVLFGLTDEDFELLAKNFARIRNHLKITNDLLDKYKEYYEGDLEETNEKQT